MEASSQTHVIFVRHGNTATTGDILPGRTPGLFLDERGIQQAEETAAYLHAQHQDIAELYSSPLERTQQTAEILAAKFTKIKPTTENGIQEADFGSWTGRKLSELRELPEWNVVQKHPSAFQFPEGESFLGIQVRMLNTIRNLAKQNLGKKIVLVSHADIIKAALTDALGMHLDLFQRIRVSPCSTSQVIYSPTRPPVVLSINTTHETQSNKA